MNSDSKMHRIVHFDLKGAPPKLLYFEQMLHSIKSWGATGVLLEWEDTFPYSANLSHLGSGNNSGGDEMYNILEVHRIISICKELGLEVIQLVQTIGHMEFVLKHPCHEQLREMDRSPASICPEKEQSKELVKHMVMQVLAVQPDAKYFHIGADEVCHIGYCYDCRKRTNSNFPQDHWRIYLDYVRDLLLFIKGQRPDITILMWDDMIRAMSPEILEEYRQLSEIVQLVVWNYDVRENFRFPPGMWVVYNKYFPTVWAGSAYKGANGSSQLVSPVSRYVRNQEAWISEIRDVCSLVKFAGVVFTGWSRYDHFATLCELLPTSLNSIVNCLKCFVAGGLDNLAELHRDNTLSHEEWPGRAVAECVQRVATLHERYLRVACGDLKMTWLNNWQLNNGYLNFFQVDNIERYVYELLVELKGQEKIVTKELGLIYGRRTCTEWFQTHFGSMEIGLAAIVHAFRYARRFDPRSSAYGIELTSSAVENVPSPFIHVPSMLERVLPRLEPTLSRVDNAAARVEHETSQVE